MPYRPDGFFGHVRTGDFGCIQSGYFGRIKSSGPIQAGHCGRIESCAGSVFLAQIPVLRVFHASVVRIKRSNKAFRKPMRDSRDSRGAPRRSAMTAGENGALRRAHRLGVSHLYGHCVVSLARNDSGGNPQKSEHEGSDFIIVGIEVCAALEQQHPHCRRVTTFGSRDQGSLPLGVGSIDVCAALH